jgi:putative tryptophan/tyrosine transport system substrate-binding protein
MRRREFMTLLGSAAASLPFSARAQQSTKMPTVGVLWHAGSAEEEATFFGPLLEGFKNLGYVDGENIRLEHRFPNELPDRFRSMTAELVALKVDVIVTVGPAAYYAKGLTGTIPHVFVYVLDAVADGFVESLARPGGYATGLTFTSADLTKKRVQLLHEAVPGTLFGFLVPNITYWRPVIDQTQAAAAELGLTLQAFQAASLGELDGAFDAMSRAGIEGLIHAEGGQARRAAVGKLASAHRLPMTVPAREFMAPGALMSYGPRMTAIIRRAPVYVDKILKGAKPSELPVEQPTNFELIIDLRVAKALGIDVPQMLIAQADEVIE